jgi:predicted house-cleaning noncanonical NTP pyrophosphatase (MazG superfamily)
MDRTKLQNNLIQEILEDMDIKCLLQIADEVLEENYNKLSDEELLEEVKELYPHLL